MTKTSKRQIEILEVIFQAIEDQGYPPTVREIGSSVGLSSTSTVHGHLSRLEAASYINRNPDSPRAIEITQKGLKLIDRDPQSNFIPVLGQVTAGDPITAFEDPIDSFPIPNDFKNEAEDLYMLVISGDSMIEAGILDGDQVIVRKQSSARNGEIVIAMTTEDEATCKRFYKEDGYFRLHPENPTMDDIILDEVTILGKVVGLYRPDIF